MLFHKTPLAGAFIIEQQPHRDERGFFARYFCAQEFREAGLVDTYPQINNTFTADKGTLRGLHFQLAPFAEAKVIRCVRGRIWDVIVDLRPDSPTFKQWYGAELDAESRQMMYAPRGFGHGVLTLCDDVELIYSMSDVFSGPHQRGLRWDDPALSIRWPIAPVLISEQDRSLPCLDAVGDELDLWLGMEAAA